MAANIQYFGDRLDFIPMRDNEAYVFFNDQPLNTLISHVEKLAIATCEICYISNYLTNIWPTFQNDLSAPIITFWRFFTTISNVVRVRTLKNGYIN